MSKSIQNALDLPLLEDLLKPQRTENGDLVDAEDEDSIDDLSEDQVEGWDESTETGVVVHRATPVSAQDIEERKEAKDHADSMDSLHKETLEHAQDLMDLAYNTDTRSAGRIFESATNMYKLAIDSKNSKRDAQLKARKLMLEARKLDILERTHKGEGDIPQNNGAAPQNVIIEDRNDLMKRLREESKNS